MILPRRSAFCNSLGGIMFAKAKVVCYMSSKIATFNENKMSDGGRERA
jgi:hypothetical protein